MAKKSSKLFLIIIPAVIIIILAVAAELLIFREQKIFLYTDGGDVSGENVEKVVDNTYVIRATVLDDVVIPYPEKEGSDFIGWVDENGKPFGGLSLFRGSYTLFAKWQEEEIFLTGLMIESAPSVTEYYIGDTVDYSGLKVLAVYSNGEEYDVTSELECPPVVLGKAGVFTVSAYFQDSCVEFDVKVKSYYEELKAGDVIEFGSYEQDNNTANGKEPVSWQILDKRDGRVLLVSEYVLDAKPMHDSASAICWDETQLRSWLNKEFIAAAFTEEESARIHIATVPADRNPRFESVQGRPTEDRVFVLSIAEINKYFPDKADRRCLPTEYARAAGVDVSFPEILDGFIDGKATAAWWTRTKNDQYIKLAFDCVSYDGSYGNSDAMNRKSVGLRPALWLDVEVDRSVTVTRISVNTNPNKTVYGVGDAFDTTGLSLRAYYSNGDSHVLVDEFGIYPQIFDKLGKTAVEFSYEGQSCGIEIEVKGVEPIHASIYTSPAKKDYYVGEIPDFSDFVMQVNYSDGSVKRLSEGYTLSAVSTDTVGQKTVEAEYDGMKVSFTINVHPLSDVQVGEILKFGNFEQDGDYSNGTEDLEWIVMDKSGGSAMLLLKKCLNCMDYGYSLADTTWEDSKARYWLNNEFYAFAFSPAEKAKIKSVNVFPHNNPEFKTNPGAETTDRLYLLSAFEATMYFDTDASRRAIASELALKNGIPIMETETGESACNWWLRTPGSNSKAAAIVTSAGTVYYQGSYVTDAKVCLRPAMWIDLS